MWMLTTDLRLQTALTLDVDVNDSEEEDELEETEQGGGLNGSSGIEEEEPGVHAWDAEDSNSLLGREERRAQRRNRFRTTQSRPTTAWWNEEEQQAAVVQPVVKPPLIARVSVWCYAEIHFNNIC